MKLDYFNSYDKDHAMMKKAFLIVTILFVGGLLAMAYYSMEEVKMARNNVVVLDKNNQTFIGQVEPMSALRRQGQLQRHVELFWKLMWDVSQERDNIKTSVDRALLMGDGSALRLYEKYYEIQGMKNFLYENSASSFVNIEEIVIDLSSYPYKGMIKSTQEIEVNYSDGNSVRRMDAKFELKNYPVSYDNPIGAQLINIEIVNDQPIDIK